MQALWIKIQDYILERRIDYVCCLWLTKLLYRDFDIKSAESNRFLPFTLPSDKTLQTVSPTVNSYDPNLKQSWSAFDPDQYFLRMQHDLVCCLSSGPDKLELIECPREREADTGEHWCDTLLFFQRALWFFYMASV